MSVARLIRSSILGVLAASLLGMFAGTSATLATTSAWWHVNSGAVPANLNPEPRDQVEEIVATPQEVEPGLMAAGFFLEFNKKELGLFVTEPYAAKLGLPAASAAHIQEALETVYGKGKVTVTAATPPAPGGAALVVSTPVSEPFEVSGAGIGPAEGKLQVEGRTSGVLVLTVADVGYARVDGTKAPVLIKDRLPKGLKALAMTAEIGEGNTHRPLECVVETLTCSVQQDVATYEPIEVQITVDAEKGAASGELNEVSVAGGETVGTSIRKPVRISAEPTRFGVEDYEMTPESEGGAADTQAGSHPFQLTTEIVLNQTFHPEGEASQRESEPLPVSLTKDLNFNLPPGLIGNPTPIPQCTLGRFLAYSPKGNADQCAPDTAVGMAILNVAIPGFANKALFPVPVFNLEPAVGEPARFGFIITQGDTPVILDTSVRTGGDYGVTVKVHNITETAGFLSSLVTFWGVPGDPRHDNMRGWGCMYKELGIAESIACAPEEAIDPPPFLSLPTACTGQLPNDVETDSWAQEGVFSTAQSEPMSAMDGCNRLPFSPSVIVTPDGRAGSTPTGLNVDEHISQSSTLAPEGLAESDVKGLTVTLPEGVAINPAGADGLLSCSMEQIALQSAEPPTCPEASKIATVTIKTPLLPEPLTGSVYLGAQTANPFGSLIAMYVFAEDPVSKLRAKAAGELVENPVTGQLTTHFEGDPLFENDPQYANIPAAQFLPEVPFEDLELHFFGGDRAPLATPARCGTYTTTSSFTPWSGNPPAESSSSFEVVSGPNGQPCSAALPFKPTLTAGTTSIQAGGFSPFTMTMSREDGEQNLRSIELHMPPGMSGTLSTVKLCGEEQADAGTCSSETEIGETTVSVGVGGDPYSVKGGKVYITGPYKGAPFGLSIVNPAKAGPFDLGKVIVRAKVEVDPTTAALTITTDTEGPYKLPTILDGIPLQIRHVNVDINRPDFTFNPTNCSPVQLTGSLGSTENAAFPVTVPFQITNCAVLAFKPKLQASTSGKVSRLNGTSLRVKLSYPAGPYDANIAKVKVELPKGLPSRLATLQKACTAAVFEANPANCPPASIIGHATATTPVLPVPLSGPAYFVSHGGEAFPSLIVVLQGYGVTVHLVGSTFISKTGITSSTFKTVPDVPVGTFELNLPAGPYSALTGLGNLCKQKLVMPTEFVGQNGALIDTNTKIATTGCAKAKHVAHRGKRKKGTRKGKKKK
jgi:hypothetical protein